MSLGRYPRPKNDTGFGFHYYPDTEHYSPHDLERWLPELERMGSSWLVLLSSLEIPIPEFFVRELLANEIEPVMRVVTGGIQPVDRSELAVLLRMYAQWGVHYAEVFCEANCASRWSLLDWTRPSLVEKFLDLLVPCLEEMQAHGLCPFFPALRPGGTYWDLSFLHTALELLISRDKRSLVDSMVVGMQNHLFDRPLEWGHGGKSRWPMARPYFTPNRSEDHLGYNLFQWYDEVVRSTVGHSLPLMCMGSAAAGDPYLSTGGVWADEESHADRAVTIARLLMDGAVPDYVLNHTFWLLATKEGDPCRVHAWYGAQGEECAAVSAMKGLLKRPRTVNGSSRPAVPPSGTVRRLADEDVEFVGLAQQMIDALHVTGPPSDGEPYWKVVRVEVQPEIDNGSAFAVADAQAVRFFWPDGEYVTAPKDDPYAPVGARHSAASMPMFATWGSYSVEVVRNSETLHGFGLYGNNLEPTYSAPHPVIVVFRLVQPDGSPLPPGPADPPDSPSTPSVPGDVEFVGLSEDMVRALSISEPRSTTEPYWKVVHVEVQPDTHNGSAFAVADAEAARFFWPDGEYVAAPKDDPLAPVGARHGAASMPMFASWGSYAVEVVGNSETIHGFGLYGDNLELTLGASHPVLVAFRLVGQPGPPSRPSPPEPSPSPSPQPRSVPYEGFPRPPGDNGMGIHLGLDTTTQAIALDIRRAKELNMTWATLCYQGDEQLLRCARMIWDAGIMPICRQVTTVGVGHPFDRDARVLLENGIPAYIQIFNEPSDEREWKHRRPRDYIERWSRLWAQKATDVYNAGGCPGLQCVHPEELEAAIDALGADSPVWDRVWFCSHNYGLNHPPEWQENYWCVLGFHFFAGIFKQRLGFVPPVICGEGGWLYGGYDDHRYPRVGGNLHARYTREMYEWFRRGTLSNGEPLPDHLFAVCPWILSGLSDEAWYGFTTKAATIRAVKDIPGFVRDSSAPSDGVAISSTIRVPDRSSMARRVRGADDR